MVPFIATLAMLASARGLALQITDGKTQIVSVDSVLKLGERDAYILGIPPLVLVFAAVTVIGWLVLNRTTFGRRTVAVGGNAEAARLAGIDVRRQRLYLYLLSGLCCGIAAFLLIILSGSGQNTNGNLYELDAIAAAIIGGTLLTGGRGTITGSVLGVLIFTTITNIFALNNLQSDVQQIAKGAIIVAAVLVQRRTATHHFLTREGPTAMPETSTSRRGLLFGDRRRLRRRPAHRLHQQRAPRTRSRRRTTSRPPTTSPASTSPSASPDRRPTTAGSTPSTTTPRAAPRSTRTSPWRPPRAPTTPPRRSARSRP